MSSSRGGSKGIGCACAAAFLAEGARVSLVSRSTEHLEAARGRLSADVHGSAGRISVHAADLQQPESAAKALADAEAQARHLIAIAKAHNLDLL